MSSNGKDPGLRNLRWRFESSQRRWCSVGRGAVMRPAVSPRPGGFQARVSEARCPGSIPGGEAAGRSGDRPSFMSWGPSGSTPDPASRSDAWCGASLMRMARMVRFHPLRPLLVLRDSEPTSAAVVEWYTHCVESAGSIVGVRVRSPPAVPRVGWDLASERWCAPQSVRVSTRRFDLGVGATALSRPGGRGFESLRVQSWACSAVVAHLNG